MLTGKVFIFDLFQRVLREKRQTTKSKDACERKAERGRCGWDRTQAKQDMEEEEETRGTRRATRRREGEEAGEWREDASEVFVARFVQRQ